MRLQSPAGLLVYEGPSALNGERIAAVLTLRSSNTKTGDVPSLWIMPADVSPIEATRSGADASVCGDCPLRPVNGGGCYVVLLRGALRVWRTYNRGGYPSCDPEELGAFVYGRAAIRLGAWGDPAALPATWWIKFEQGLARLRRYRRPTVLGYSHLWRLRPDLARWCMASVHTEHDASAAMSAGWRPFLATLEPPASKVAGRHTFLCPASNEAGNRLTCTSCRACDGRRDGSDLRAVPWTGLHSSRPVLAKVRRAVARLTLALSAA